MTLTHLEKLRILSRMFSRPLFSTMARTGDWKRVSAYLAGHRMLRHGSAQSVSSLFDQAWNQLRLSYRNEYVYKSELANRIVFGRHSPRKAAMHVEFPVGRSVVDIAIFNGTSTAYEVKTEFDSPRRLQSQTSDYLKVFDKVYVVAHPTTAAAYAEIVQDGVGVIALNRRGSLSVLREAVSNRGQLDVRTIFRCLHRAEYVPIIESTLETTFALPNGIIARKCEEEFCKFSTWDAHEAFVSSMRNRKTDLRTADFVTKLPPSLRVLGYATPLSERQRANLLRALDLEITLAIA